MDQVDPSPCNVPLAEALAALRAGIASDEPFRLVVPSQAWGGCAGDVPFVVGTWIFVFFCDAGDLDYCDSVLTPDGRFAEFEDFNRDAGDDELFELTDSLTREEFIRLQEKLEAAR